MGSYVVYKLPYLVLSLPLLTLLAPACEMRHTKDPLYGHRCISSSDVVVRQEDHRGCQWRCLRIQDCSYINHTPESDRCEIGLGQCESLAPAVGVMVNVYWSPRDVCLHWGSHQEVGRVAVGEGGMSPPRYVGRTYVGEAMVLGQILVMPTSIVQRRCNRSAQYNCWLSIVLVTLHWWWPPSQRCSCRRISHWWNSNLRSTDAFRLGRAQWLL